MLPIAADRPFEEAAQRVADRMFLQTSTDETHVLRCSGRCTMHVCVSLMPRAVSLSCQRWHCRVEHGKFASALDQCCGVEWIHPSRDLY